MPFAGWHQEWNERTQRLLKGGRELRKLNWTSVETKRENLFCGEVQYKKKGELVLGGGSYTVTAILSQRAR